MDSATGGHETGTFAKNCNPRKKNPRRPLFCSAHAGDAQLGATRSWCVAPRARSTLPSGGARAGRACRGPRVDAPGPKAPEGPKGTGGRASRNAPARSKPRRRAPRLSCGPARFERGNCPISTPLGREERRRRVPGARVPYSRGLGALPPRACADGKRRKGKRQKAQGKRPETQGKTARNARKNGKKRQEKRPYFCPRRLGNI